MIRKSKDMIGSIAAVISIQICVGDADLMRRHILKCPHDTGHLESRVRFIIGLEISLGLAPKTLFYYAYVLTKRRVILELGLRYWYRCLETGA